MGNNPGLRLFLRGSGVGAPGNDERHIETELITRQKHPVESWLEKEGTPVLMCLPVSCQGQQVLMLITSTENGSKSTHKHTHTDLP